MMGKRTEPSDVEQPIAIPRDEEFHVTVEGSPYDWARFCEDEGITALFIELSDRRLQLMCAMDTDPQEAGDHPSFVVTAVDRGFTVVRVKHEVRELRAGETALYYEAHAKFDGSYRPDRKGASRDLYRPFPQQRWYLTSRSAAPIDADTFTASAQLLGKHATFVGIETEVVLVDTNPGLDAGWL